MPDRENVECGVDVAIVDRSAVAARPFSYSKSGCASGPTVGQTAAGGADLGRVPFRDFPYLNAGLLAFVPQHCLEESPTGVSGGLCQSGSADGSRGNIPDVDRRCGVDDLAGELVQGVAPLALDLPVESGGALPLLCSLSNGQLLLYAAIPPGVLQPASVGADGYFLESEIDPDGITAGVRSRFYEYLYAEVPMAAGVLREAASSKGVLGESVRVPDTEVVPGETDSAGSPYSRLGFERYPTQAPTLTVSLPPAKARALSSSTLGGVLVRSFLDCCSLDQIEFSRCPDRERVKVVPRQELPFPAVHLDLMPIDLVPNSVDLCSHPSQDRSVAILDADAQGADKLGLIGHLVASPPGVGALVSAGVPSTDHYSTSARWQFL